MLQTMFDDRDEGGKMPHSWDLPDVADLGDVELSQILRHLIGLRRQVAGRRRLTQQLAVTSKRDSGS